MTNETDQAEWHCLRCLWIVSGREGEEIPVHAAECPFHDTGKDPEPKELAIGGAHAG